MSEVYNGLTHQEILIELDNIIDKADSAKLYGIGDVVYDILIALTLEWEKEPKEPKERRLFHEKIKRKVKILIDNESDALLSQLREENKISSGDTPPEEEWEFDEAKWSLAEAITGIIDCQKYDR